MALTLGVNSGFVTSAPSVDPNETGTTIDGSSVVTKHTAPANSEKITQIGWYRASGTNAANFEIALYADVAGVPVTRLFVDATNSTTSNGWVAVAVDWAITPGTAYWLGLQMDAHSGSSSVDGAASGGAGSDVLTSQTALNDPYGGGLVADADGMYAIYALVQLSITGTGSPDAQSSAADGTGTSASSGTGSPDAGAAVVAGSGAATWNASGAAAAAAAAAGGAGDSGSTGTGSPDAAAVTVDGSGVSASTGTGAPATQAASVDGAGVSASVGTAALLSGAATIDGAGTVESAGAVTGSGAIQVSAALVVGAGITASSGAGALAAAAATVNGTDAEGSNREEVWMTHLASIDATMFRL